MFTDGFCNKHGLHWLECNDCRETWQKSETLKWFKKQADNAASVKHFNNVTLAKHYTVAGDPVQIEKFR